MNPPLIAFLFIFFTSSSYGQDNEQYLECFRSVFNCGDTIQDITYPFWGDARPRYCGLEEFELTCQNNEFATIDIGAQKFRVLDILKSNPYMRIARDDLRNDVCPQEFSNTTLDHSPFAYLPAYYENLTFFYDCADEIIKTTSARNTFNCSISGENRIRRRGFYAEDPFSPAEIQNVERCGINMTVPVIREAVKAFRVDYTKGVWELVNLGFLVEYRIENNRSCLACVAPGRLCWINGTSFEDYACLCPKGGVGPLVCSRNSSGATNCLACEASGGRCRSSSTSLENSACLCPNGGVVPLVCSTNSLSASKLNIRLKILIGTGAALSAVLSMCFLIFCVKKCSSTRSVAFWERETEIDKNVEAFIRQHGSSTPKRYKYSDVKKITNSFKEELGRGGYGNVYKGMLADGRLVAVKILDATKGNGEEFINEVASIGRTCHVNVVTLLGFCYEGKKRALIYEFMCNGSLEKCIYHISPQSNGQHLGWEKLYQIALGIARGLEYLHRGCNTRILHFDIKPHNILLDEDFCPKIADFGLAKRYHGKDSIVSMAEARGTIGYIAPEVCSRRGVSHKSDVYSYGMMLLEMVGGRRNVDAGVVHTSEIYFPHWIYNRLELNEDLQLRGVTHIQENEIARRMLIVGLWCIQTDPMHRPPMNKVIQMLEGSMEALQIPPKPFLSSPPRSPPVLLEEPPGLTKLKSTQNPRKSLSGISTNTWRAENQTKIKNF